MNSNEDGHVLVLAVGLALVCFAVAGLAVDGTRAFLARRALQNVADAASVAGAAEIDTRAYYRSGGSQVRLAPTLGEEAVVRTLGRRELPTDVQLIIRDERVEIVLRSDVETSFLKLVGIDKIPVGASAAAEPFPSIGR